MSVLEQILQEIQKYETEMEEEGISCLCPAWVKDIIRKHLPDNGGWIPVEERMPECEKEVWIITEKGTQTSAMYEDGTMLEKNSAWYWDCIDGEWDDEEDCMIVPEGWWEYRHFHPDDVYNCPVDEKVIAWQPIPKSYRPKEVK